MSLLYLGSKDTGCDVLLVVDLLFGYISAVFGLVVIFLFLPHLTLTASARLVVALRVSKIWEENWEGRLISFWFRF